VNGHRANKTSHYVFAIAFGVFGAFAVWYWGAPGPNALTPRVSDDSGGPSEQPVGEALRWNPTAESYIRAVVGGRCDDVIEMTNWMQERLEYVRRTEPESEIEARATLCAALQERRPEGNQLTNEGIADQYLFAPGVKYELVATDAGRIDLSDPVMARNWVQLRFPSGYRAPKDREGVPIRTLRVGINISADEKILKAGVRGTVEIDWESISTGWTKNEGE